MVELAGNEDAGACEVLDAALHAALVGVGEGAGVIRVKERPAAVLLIAKDAGSGGVAVLVLQGIEAHQHLPCHALVEGFCQRRILVVGGIEVVGGKCLCRA